MDYTSIACNRVRWEVFVRTGRQSWMNFLAKNVGLSLSFSKQNLYQAVSVVFTCRRTRLLKLHGDLCKLEN